MTTAAAIPVTPAAHHAWARSLRADSCPTLLPQRELKLKERRVLAPPPWFAEHGAVLGIRAAANGNLLLLTQQESPRLYEFDSTGRIIRHPTFDSLAALYPGRFKGPFPLQSGGVAVLSLDSSITVLSTAPTSAPMVRRAAGIQGRGFDWYFVDAMGRASASRSTESGWRSIVGEADSFPLPATTNHRQFIRNHDSLVTINHRVPFYPEQRWAAGSGGAIHWSDGSTRPIYRVTTRGSEVVGCVAEGTQVAIAADEQAQWTEALTWMSLRNQPSWTWNGPVVPAFKPAIEELFVDLQGRTWVKSPAPSTPIAAGKRVRFALGDSTSPWIRWEPQFVVGTAVPSGTRPVWFRLPERTLTSNSWIVDRNSLWVVRFDANRTGIELVEFRLEG